MVDPLSPADHEASNYYVCERPNDAYMRQDDSAHFNRPFGGYKRAMSLRFSEHALLSFVYILAA